MEVSTKSRVPFPCSYVFSILGPGAHFGPHIFGACAGDLKLELLTLYLLGRGYEGTLGYIGYVCRGTSGYRRVNRGI